MNVGDLVEDIKGGFIGVIVERHDNEHGPSYIDDLTGTMVPHLLYRVVTSEGEILYKADSQLREVKEA